MSTPANKDELAAKTKVNNNILPHTMVVVWVGQSMGFQSCALVPQPLHTKSRGKEKATLELVNTLFGAHILPSPKSGGEAEQVQMHIRTAYIRQSGKATQLTPPPQKKISVMHLERMTTIFQQRNSTHKGYFKGKLLKKPKSKPEHDICSCRRLFIPKIISLISFLLALRHSKKNLLIMINNRTE